MLFQDDHFRKFNHWMAWTRDVDPSKCKGYMLATSSRLYIFILVIQDHTESIGKPILLKGDDVLLNGLLAQNA